MKGATGKGVGKADDPLHRTPPDKKNPPGITTSNDAGVVSGAKDQYAAKCLYEKDAYMSASWAGISTCTTASDGNGWFDASLCLEQSFDGCQPGGGLALKNSGALHMDVLLFGIPFNILNATAVANYDSTVGAQPFKDPGGNDPKVVIGLTGEEVDPKDLQKEINFLGPQTIVPIGPVPVSIKTGLYARFGLNSPDPVSFPGVFPAGFPLTCDGGKQSGTLKMQLGVNAYASLWASASVDAYVAEAGMRADLILADDTFGMFMDTKVTPATNTVNVAPLFGYKLKHLAGMVVLFVDVDVIVYSKRWEVELFQFEGFKVEGPQAGDKTFPQSINFGARRAT
ncbi:MAG: hypothetical protein LC785_16180 [Acidobacteria bacterium]|nr:hypothetical protein [Acidobacteriota bacterium]MCA1643442.1 hypothetical protein [Acidobacteriota bacterium]